MTSNFIFGHLSVRMQIGHALHSNATFGRGYDPGVLSIQKLREQIKTQLFPFDGYKYLNKGQSYSEIKLL